ncbi:serine/threonine-protein kinase, partial [Actinocorallia lasiicapitis]
MDTFEQGAGTAWRVPGFEHLTLLGEGGFGAAFLVREGETGQVGVLKYVATFDEGARRDFRRESALLKGVASPYVARWFGHMEGPGHAAIFMEAVRGVSLRALLDERGPLAPEAALTVLKGSLLGLAAAHARGVVHRDYKPSNVIVGPDGVSKLIDFGIAGLVGEKASSGTPHYMAPEQWARLPSTAGTDVYAATCVFYECLTGRRPYDGTGLHELRAQHLSAEPPPAGSWPELSALLASGMAKAQDQRPTDALTFVAELELVAGQAYGADWESRGWAILRAAAAALAPLAA